MHHKKLLTSLSVVLMGNLSQAFNFKGIVTTLFFLFLMIPYTYTASSHPSNQQKQKQKQIQPQSPSSSSTIPAHHHQHQVFYLKNTDEHPMFLSRQERFKMRRINRNKNMKKHRKNKKKMVKNLQSRPFSVMLPKGFVPPSGSSPCHNDQPNSVSFHCDLTTSTQP